MEKAYGSLTHPLPLVKGWAYPVPILGVHALLRFPVHHGLTTACIADREGFPGSPWEPDEPHVSNFHLRSKSFRKEIKNNLTSKQEPPMFGMNIHSMA